MINIDILDKKILNILIGHGRAEYAEIARLTGTSTERIYYRVNRLVKKNIIREFKVLLSYGNLGYNQYNIFIKLKHINSELREKYQEYFKKHPFTVWVGTCIGEFDFRIYVVSKNHFHLKELLTQIDADLGSDIDSMIVLHRIKKYDGINYLTFRKYSDEKECEEIKNTLSRIKIENHTKPVSILDEKDVKILKTLCYNPRAKYTEIAKTMNVTPEDIKYRMNKINSTVAISRYSISMNYPKLGLLWLALLVRITQKNKTKEFIQDIINMPQTVNVIDNLGEWDLEITFYAKNIEEVDKYILDIREKYSDAIVDYKFFITHDNLKSPQVAEGVFETLVTKHSLKAN